ncbi:GTP-binding protein LepA [Alkalispirochaeta americana]|uniref:Elongation factor 4 n=1 Tax=Alkalispirochaeta americana TaxID=159291 RepID=A0A1N6QYX4_9SPIO|nr:translation elongation factor 4 [Alkalispirochaeta americana]SIQ21768.1 GTP-binding protein LepA [Alkalispirochaeta americana]
MNQRNVRNFCIIAHIDHGKSTLADRFIQRSKIVEERDFRDQLLDSMDIERERGITIKSQAVTLPVEFEDGLYLLNLVDTPGHVDFSYEVSRAISSCEGAVLLIDAAQGVEAQTLSNLYLAFDHDLHIIPVINKIDLPAADIDNCLHQINHDLGLDPDEAVLVSGKTGQGVEDLLRAIVEHIPAPAGEPEKPLQALVFDSHYDPYRGVIVHLRVFDGTLKPGDTIEMWSSGLQYEVEEIGRFKIALEKTGQLSAGDVGYLIAGIKTIRDVRVGDTVTRPDARCKTALPGFREVKPVVFSSIYPVDTNEYQGLVQAMDKLRLNDASLVFEKDNSAALGFGFRCGFLGMLHLEVIQERLEREFDLNLVLTAPSVEYEIELNDGTRLLVDSPMDYPDPGTIKLAMEPFIRASIITPDTYLGPMLSLCNDRRGIQKDMIYLDTSRVELVFEMPLAEVLFDFYDNLKSLSRGYASFDYELIDRRPVQLARLDILVNGKPVDALSMLVYRGNAERRARAACKQLRQEIPRHQFKVPIQGAIGGTVIARETIPALRKDVTAKCYGGDISRKRKLLEKQKEGKKRMKTVGNVELPQSAFLSVLKGSPEE